jgi:1-phosphofructokinase
MNLAIDLFIKTQDMKPQVVNRTEEDDIQANGKGVNISLILKLLGINSIALGFSGGFTGRYIEEYLALHGIQTDFVKSDGLTRINVFTQVVSEDTEYKLVNKGPSISKESIDQLLNIIRNIERGDYLCVSGSLPKGASPEILVEISKICHQKGIHLIIDTSYSEILKCLEYKPFLLKPNEEELATWFGQGVIEEGDYSKYLTELLSMGAQNVLFSMGSKGAIFISGNEQLQGNAPEGKIVNTAGAGDTLLGTFLARLIQGADYSSALRFALAAGSSTAFRKGLTDFSDVEKLIGQIHIQQK